MKKIFYTSVLCGAMLAPQAIARLGTTQGAPTDAGKQQVHNRLAFDERGVPRLYVFSSCRQFIRTFPCLVYSSSDVEDVDTTGEDHIYDELRYVCMDRPLHPARRSPEIKRIEYDPLDTFEMNYRTRALFR